MKAMICLALVFVLCEVSLVAQVTGHKTAYTPQAVTNMDVLASRKSAAKVTGAPSRLIAQYHGASRFTGNIIHQDSTTYSYSGNRGGDLHSTILFDSLKTFIWDSAANAYAPEQLITTSYDANSHILTDTFRGWNGSTFANGLCRTYTYDPAGNLLTRTTQVPDPVNTWRNFRKTIWSVDSSLRTATEVLLWFTGGLWDPAEQQISTYNPSWKLINHLSQFHNGTDWENDTRDLYIYDPTGNPIVKTHEEWSWRDLIWLNSERQRYYYNSANQQTAMSTQTSFFGGTYQYNDSTAHTSVTSTGAPLITNSYYHDGTAWLLDGRATTVYNTAGDPVSHLTERWRNGAWSNAKRIFCVYNGFGQATKEYSESWLPTNTWGIMPWNDYESRYYYQQYNTAVPMTVTVSNSLIVYPNPGTGLFSMRYPNEYYNMASVYDALGRIVYQRAVQSVGKDVLDLNGLRTGSYLIRLSGKAPSISAPLIIER